jgi:transcriptional regulator with XRE-family HTH domain
MMSGMADKTTPTLRGRRLAGELRALRERSRLSQAEAARRVGMSPSKLSRIEDARTRATEDDVSALLQMYGLDIDRHPAILKLVEDSWQRGWWTAYGDAFDGSFHMLEDQAPEMCVYETMLIPGPFQTADYAEAILSQRPGIDNDDLDRLVEVRMARKRVLTRRNPPKLSAVINEAALRQVVGDPDLMRKQISEVWTTAMHHDNVTVQVLPFTAGLPTGLLGPFTLFNFPDDHGLDVAYSEDPLGEWYAESNEQLTRLRVAFEDVSRAALTPDDSLRWLADRTRE